MSDVACDPELPPELMMSGMNSASTTALAISPSKPLHRRRGEHLRQEQRAQPARALLDHAPEADLDVRLVERLHTAELLHVLGLLADDRVDHVVHRDDAEHALARRRRPAAASRLYFEMMRATSSRSVRGAHGERRAPIADVERPCCRAIGDHELAQRDDVRRARSSCVEDVDRVDRLLRAPDLADVVERLLDGPVGGHAHELRRHDAAGGVRRVLQQELERLPRRRVERFERGARARLRAARGRGRPAGRPTSPR